MRNIVTAVCWLALLSPVAVYALDADYPSLGVRVTNLPANAKNLGVSEQFKGYEAGISLGAGATIQIVRLDEPAPEGDMKDDAYRNALFKQFGIPAAGGSIHGLTSVSGHIAWVSGFAQRLGPMLAYHCNYYLVVGQHLDEITISAVDRAKTARASFDTAVQVIASDLIFEAVQRPPEKSLAPGEMPTFLLGDMATPYYSARARRLGTHGEVDLEFNINDAGKAQGAKAVNGADADLVDSALSMLRSGGFRVPKTWEQSGGTKQTFKMVFRFQLSCPADQQPPEDPHVVRICASLVAR